MNLKKTVEDGRTFNLAIQALILVSLVCFCIETLPNLSAEARYWLFVLEVFAVSVFTIEYALRILVADNRLKFISSFYGLVDLIAILPFYVALGIDLRTIRVLRIFRVFRILKFLRYTKAIDRFKLAFHEIKEELVLFVIAAMLVVFLASVGIYYFEGETQPDTFGSIFHCMWWAVVTLTTVGYGDALPITVGGRIFTGMILIVGIGIIAIPTGLFTAALSVDRKRTATPSRRSDDPSESHADAADTWSK
jgi:voltage-gated potassium channel